MATRIGALSVLVELPSTDGSLTRFMAAAFVYCRVSISEKNVMGVTVQTCREVSTVI
jgi:chorismate-pyruvate lyase